MIKIHGGIPMIRIKAFPPEKNMELYYQRIVDHLEITSIWRNLAGKAEAGSTRSEKGYQLIALSMAEKIAKTLGLCKSKAMAISMCVGCGFPKYGREGRALLAQYVTEHNLDIDLSILEVLVVEDYISTRLFVADQLDQILREYYSPIPTAQLKTPEAAVVRVCQDAIRKIKLLEYYTAADGGALLLETSDALCEACRLAEKPVESQKLTDLTKNLPEYPTNLMTEQERSARIEEITGFVTAFGDEGILKVFSI